MIIYQSEIDDGLANHINQSVVSFTTELTLTDAIPNKKLPESVLATNVNQKDLFYFKSILASVGWNKNDDVFDPYYTYLYHKTAEDKPLDLEHDHNIIIGHMTDNYCIDDDGNLLSDNLINTEIPDKFHVVAEAVIYKYWRNPDQLELIEQIIADILDNKYFVSMECLLRDFDYALIDENGEKTVVARNNITANLTKYLRCYGGDGVYKNYRIGRLLKDFIFSGKGLTKKPANPESVILANCSTNEIQMSKELETKIADLENQLATAKKERDDFSTSLSAEKSNVTKLITEKSELEATVATISEKDKAIEKLTTDNEKLQKSVAELTVAKNDLAKTNSELSTKAEDTSKKLAESEKVYAELLSANVKRDRIEKLRKFVWANEDEMLDSYTKLANLDEATFDHVVSFFAKNTETVDTEEVDPAGEAVAASTDIENVASPSNPALSTSLNAAESVVAEISDFFGKQLENSKKKKK